MNPSFWHTYKNTSWKIFQVKANHFLFFRVKLPPDYVEIAGDEFTT